ncbi:diguanylate cyclase [Terrihabitans soli]|uniref:Diguanylate cyclase n=1 Tax=Terrihabitans soli TaxID=708113 RepID=A0A6S6QRG1_9HYPH|nr:sensor domain-containing phosphodiesterase [Terrihabitans soli]BCJ91639.1 diguanylate cyclase [Terrihabitans soli]
MEVRRERAAGETGVLTFVRAVLCALLVICGLSVASGRALALEPIVVPLDRGAIDLTRTIERFASEGDRVQVTTAPSADGIVRRIEVRAHDEGPTDWALFALTNTSDEQIDRLLVAPHYRLVGSGIFWPDLGSRRIVDVTASQGFRPEREESPDTDIFVITLDPGATVTFVAELENSKLPQLHLWDPDAYKDSVNDLTLYKGIVLGIAGLLALILTIVFVVKGSAMFPASGALAWAVLAWLAIDFGFWHKMFKLGPGQDHIYRAGAEAMLAATLIVFLVAYLNLNRWHVRFGHVALVWLAGMMALVGIALIDAPIAAGIARISLLLVSVLGFGVVVWLALHNFDRAVMLIPSWFLLVAWVAAAGLTVSGFLENDIVSPALVGGLVLIVLLLGFTVMQHAFAGAGLAHGLGSDLERRALAITGSGDLVWDWDVTADRIHVTQEFEHLLGLKKGDLHGPAAAWLDVLHPSDRDRFRAALDMIVGERRGRVSEQFRFRAQDGHYHYMLLRIRPVVAAHGEVTRCVGTLIDITDSKAAEERLLRNAVYDSLTGLPNRQLFLDRVEAALSFAATDEKIRPIVLVINLDKFKVVNDKVGLTAGDTLLLTLVRRIGQKLKPQDMLARLGGDQFGILLLSEREGPRVSQFAEGVRKAISQPIQVSGVEVVLTGSTGLAMMEPRAAVTCEDLVRNAEVAMFHAKRAGGNHIEVFKATMRTAKTDRLLVEGELRRSLEREEIRLLYQPIIRLEDRAIVGFEAMMRWDHPSYSRRPPAEFLAIAEETGLIVELSLFALDRASRQLASWQRRLPTEPPLFITVNLPARQFERQDLIQDIKTVLSRTILARGSLKLELTEKLVVQSPERAAHLLERLRDLGVGLALDDFGTSHANLAYLERFSFDTVKMDRSFLRQHSKVHRTAILRSMIQLGRELGLDVIAEGAETDSDAVELYHLGCQYAQGQAFGEPMTVEQCEKLLDLTSEHSPMSSARRVVMSALRT